MQVKKAMDSIAVGERVEIVATDAGFARDASAWCDTTGNKLIEKHDEKGRYTVVIEKGAPACTSASSTNRCLLSSLGFQCFRSRGEGKDADSVQ